MKILVIDSLNIENGYREDFWNQHKTFFNNIKIEIPRPKDGNIVKEALGNGRFIELDLQNYDLILIHERDDSNTGYEATALAQNKKIILYSDAFDEVPYYRKEEKILKIKGVVLYATLSNFLSSINNTGLIDLEILLGNDETFEKLLLPFALINPFDIKNSLKNEKAQLQAYVSELLKNKK